MQVTCLVAKALPIAATIAMVSNTNLNFFMINEIIGLMIPTLLLQVFGCPWTECY